MLEERNRQNGPSPQDNRAGSIVTEYIVEEKDTLDDIARRYGVSIDEIMAANPETVHNTADLTRPGSRILIPRKTKD